MNISKISKMEYKCLEDSGKISGYASVFNIVDEYGDVTLQGAFSNAVKKFEEGKQRPKLLWQHDLNVPIGIIEKMYEDDYGLFIQCQLLLEISKGKEAYTLLKNKVVDGFSIGYKIKDSYLYNGVSYLTDIELLEVSIVTFPACKEAIVENVKNNNAIFEIEKIFEYIKLIQSISRKVKNLNLIKQ